MEISQTTQGKPVGLAKRVLALTMAVVFAADFVAAAPLLSPLLSKGLSEAQQGRLINNAQFLRLSFSPEGDLLRTLTDAQTGRVESKKIEKKKADKVLTFLSKISVDDPELGMALAMQSYLAPRMDPRSLDNNVFVKRDSEERLRLTDLGKTALVDILTATDGDLLEPAPEPVLKDPQVRSAGKVKSARLGGLGGAGNLDAARAAVGDGSSSFDGTRHELGDFDWNDIDKSVSAAGGLKGFAKTADARGYSYDEEAGTVRVLVAADRAAEKDFLKVGDASSVKSAVYGQTGLDEKLFDNHGAKIVRVVDNIVAIDIPLPSAAKLGLALKEKGIESRPARVYRAATAGAAAAVHSPAASFLGGGLLPVPTGTEADKKIAFRPKLAESQVSVDADGLRSKGMSGRGAYVGIIDSGTDLNHKDFIDQDGRSRVKEYMDFTEEGYDDYIGHGTHVNGIIGGDGEMSDGKFKGMAPEANFKVAKVFGKKGETDESVILAAMKWMRQGHRVDVVNMSLGGPGTANKDPLSSMANQMTVKDNILVVAAAGNEGPFDGSIGSPGNGRYVLTTGGVDKEGKPVFFSSRGPITDENGELLYAKPDLVAVAGGVDFSAVEQQMLLVDGAGRAVDGAGASAAVKAEPVDGSCVYSPGIAAPRSSADPDAACVVKGNPNYRFMSGTSQAAPMTAGFSADVVGYLKGKNAKVDAFEIKAVLMETSVDLNQKKEFQGAGLINGTRAATAVIERVKRGLPIGNIAYSLAMRLTSTDQEKLKTQNRYELTPVGLLDTHTGRLLNSEVELQRALEEIRRKNPPVLMVGRESGVASA